MAVLRGSIFSSVLQMDTDITVITPRKVKYTEGVNKVIYLLHGITENNGSWSNNLGLILLSQEYNITFIMPEVQRSFYIDMMYGPRYYTYIAEELPDIIKSLFNISSKREDTYIFGISMGGYGALKCALKNPEKYYCCGAFSPACDIKGIFYKYINDENKMLGNELRAGFGLNGELLEENDLYLISEGCIKKSTKPKILITVGKEDWLIDMVDDYCEYIKKLKFDFEYIKLEGEHNWKCWNEAINLALEKFIKEE